LLAQLLLLLRQLLVLVPVLLLLGGSVVLRLLLSGRRLESRGVHVHILVASASVWTDVEAAGT
jgi:hypothetical protein